MVLSNLLMAFAPDLFFICLAMALSALANAMFSGTASALTYDSLKPVSYTHLDVYKRQPRPWRSCPHTRWHT